MKHIETPGTSLQINTGVWSLGEKKAAALAVRFVDLGFNCNMHHWRWFPSLCILWTNPVTTRMFLASASIRSWGSKSLSSRTGHKIVLLILYVIKPHKSFLLQHVTGKICQITSQWLSDTCISSGCHRTFGPSPTVWAVPPSGSVKMSSERIEELFGADLGIILSVKECRSMPRLYEI